MKKIKDSRGAMNAIRIAAMFILVMVAFGCRKSERETAEEKAIERHKQERGLPPPTGPGFARLKSQANFLENLHTNGLLPGVSKDLNGYFGADVDLYITPEGGSTQEVVFWTHDKPRQDYHYIVGRVSSNSSWHITKAWHSDQSGKGIEQYPIQ